MFKKIKSALTNTKKTLEKKETISQLKEQSKSKATKRSKKMRPADVSCVRVRHQLKQEEIIHEDPVKEIKEEIVVEKVKAPKEESVDTGMNNENEFLSTAKTNKYLGRLYADGVTEGLGIGIVGLCVAACNASLNKGIFSMITIDFLTVMFYIALRLTLRAIKDVFGKFALKLENGANIHSSEEFIAVILSSFLAFILGSEMAMNHIDFFHAFCVVFSPERLSGILVFIILDIAYVFGTRAIRNIINGIDLDEDDKD